MMNNTVVELVLVATASLVLIHYWKQILLALLVTVVSVFCFGLYEIASLLQA